MFCCATNFMSDFQRCCVDDKSQALQCTLAMPKYGTVRVGAMAENLELVRESLEKVGNELRAAVQKDKAKRASRSVLKDAVAIATSTPDGLLVAEHWIQFNGVTDAESLRAAMDRVRERVPTSNACGVEPIDGTSGVAKNDLLVSCRGRKFLTEYKLNSWLEAQNVGKGVAPARAQVWQQRLVLNACPGKVSKTKKGQRQWCRRWRARWGVTSGRICCREVVPEKDMQEKVRGSGFRPKMHPFLSVLE